MFYKLKYRKPVSIGLKYQREMTKRIRHTSIGDVRVSTVFLGIDHGIYFDVKKQGKPILFETMIFGGEHGGYQTRCSTHRQALAMHKAAINNVKGFS